LIDLNLRLEYESASNEVLAMPVIKFWETFKSHS